MGIFLKKMLRVALKIFLFCRLQKGRTDGVGRWLGPGDDAGNTAEDADVIALFVRGLRIDASAGVQAIPRLKTLWYPLVPSRSPGMVQALQHWFARVVQAQGTTQSEKNGNSSKWNQTCHFCKSSIKI